MPAPKQVAWQAAITCTNHLHAVLKHAMLPESFWLASCSRAFRLRAAAHVWRASAVSTSAPACAHASTLASSHDAFVRGAGSVCTTALGWLRVRTFEVAASALRPRRLGELQVFAMSRAVTNRGRQTASFGRVCLLLQPSRSARRIACCAKREPASAAGARTGPIRAAAGAAGTPAGAAGAPAGQRADAVIQGALTAQVVIDAAECTSWGAGVTHLPPAQHMNTNKCAGFHCAFRVHFVRTRRTHAWLMYS